MADCAMADSIWLRNGHVAFAAEHQPGAIGPLLNFLGGGDEFFHRPAFGRAVFRAGIQAENRLRDFIQAEFFLRGFNFVRRRRTIAAAAVPGSRPARRRDADTREFDGAVEG